MIDPSDQHLILFASLFRGRQNIYARRWERESRSGYMPACDVEWSGYKEHEAKGGHSTTIPFRSICLSIKQNIL